MCAEKRFLISVSVWVWIGLAVRPAVTGAADAGQAGLGNYMVVDISGGSSASNYPVTYLQAAPAGGWTEADKTTRLVLRRIPAGSFTMGSPVEELGYNANEKQHTVQLTKDFYIGVFEVTQRQWELVAGNRLSYFDNEAHYASRPVEQVSYYQIRENPDSSAMQTSWPKEANPHKDSFMGRLRRRTGLATLDLPTEAQWEYACRAGTKTALNSGKDLTALQNCPNMSAVGRYWYNGGAGFSKNGSPGTGTATVGSYLPNAWGLYDMHGNVWEWCLDWSGPYAENAKDPAGAASGSTRVRRGGSWRHGAAMVSRSACRANSGPMHRDDFLGFRVACTVP